MDVTDDDWRTRLAKLTIPHAALFSLINGGGNNDDDDEKDALQLVNEVRVHLTEWFETIHLALFTLEQEKAVSLTPLMPVEAAMQQVKPAMEQLEMIISSAPATRATVTKLQSEWSGLQHYLASVRHGCQAAMDTYALKTDMDTVLQEMDHLSVLLFQYQEQRSQGKHSDEHDRVLVDIEDQVGPLFTKVEQIYHRMATRHEDDELQSRHRQVQDQWEGLRLDIDHLKADLKEDRWLAVFKQVSDQVDAMMDGLDKTVLQCQQMMDHIKASIQSPTAVSMVHQQQPLPQQMHQQQPLHQQQPYPIPPKGILRSSSSSSTTSSSTTTTTTSHQTPVAAAATHTPVLNVDHAKFRATEKNFEAKYKYCTPLISKMLAMLGSGIAARVSQDHDTTARHQHMVERWHTLKSTLDDLRIRDLPDMERFFFFDRPVSPAWSKVSSDDARSSSDASSSLRFRSPEPSLYERMGSPLDAHHNTQRSPSSSNNGYMSPTSHLYGMYEELRRAGGGGRSATPNGSHSNSNRWRATNGNGNGNGHNGHHRSNNQGAMSPILRRSSPLHHLQAANASMFSMRDPVPSSSDTSNASRAVRARSPRPGTATGTRRSETPSLIPRPKTPSSDMPSQIPRPRSSLAAVAAQSSTNVHRKRSSPQLTHHRSLTTTERRPYDWLHELEDDQDDESVDELDGYARRNAHPSSNRQKIWYRSDPKDPLDVEVGMIVNRSAIQIHCQRAQQGRYYFGHELHGGKKMYACKLMTYGDRRNAHASSKNKVLVRIGGGWEDLEIFFLEHHNLLSVH
ncbi:hypothetical protein BC940DRAFT_295984 [Gongronella butleri]|nr:hypothetical protein BC940DRAFT_295984 [Gongronella butleri]